MRIFICILSLSSTLALGAACCGGSSAAPMTITGDDQYQLTASFALTQVIGDAPAQGIPVFRAPSDLERQAILKVDGAFLISDQFQMGFSLPFSRRTRRTTSLNESASGLGDITLNSTYEILPEYTYSSLRPHVFTFSTLTIPTGTSTYSSRGGLGVDAMGRGFYSFSLGAMALKNFGDWDTSFTLELHRAFSRSFNTPSGMLSVNPGWGGSASLGIGYSLGDFRIGLGLSPLYEEGIRTEQTGLISTSTYQLVWNTSLQISYLIEKDWSLTASYIDQTLVGPAINVALNRSVAFLVQRRWER